MEPTGVTRRLAAVVFADVAGYTRMMGEDEDATLTAWWSHRHDVIDPEVEAHGGRIVKLTGDGFLAEFGTAQDAVKCAVKMQTEITRRNAGTPENLRMKFRMGINLGDIVDDSEDIYGDGVNIAARLEGLSEAGGICISGSVFDQIYNKLDLEFEDLGEQSVKNVAKPVRVYKLVQVAPEPAEPSGVKKDDIVVVGGRPSIAVLPFDNMSNDEEQEYFADGMTEDIITALSKVRWFLVIARNSTFAYKGTSPDIRQVARELDVHYVLEGSVRKSGNRIRINAQLIDGANGNHVWAEKYDRQLEDIFDLQDEITQTIVAAIEPEMGRAEREKAKSKPRGNLDAWNLYHLGRSHLHKRTEESLAKARELFDQALEADPGMASVHADIAEICFLGIRLGFADDPAHCLEDGLAAARKAVELDDGDAAGHFALGRMLSMRRDHLGAIPEMEKAIRINPSFAMAHLGFGMALAYSGRAEEAIKPLETAIDLSPRDEYMGPFLARLAEAHLFLRDHDEAADWARRATRQANLPWPGHAALISALGHLGKLEEAAEAIATLNKMVPDITLGYIRPKLPISDEGDLDHLMEGLEKAGIPA